MALQPNGDITPCVFMPIVIGNIRKDRIGRLWRQNEILWKLRNRDILEGHCGECEWRLHCGGCRARAYGYFGDITALDAGCILNLESWHRLKKKSPLMQAKDGDGMGRPFICSGALARN